MNDKPAVFTVDSAKKIVSTLKDLSSRPVNNMQGISSSGGVRQTFVKLGAHISGQKFNAETMQLAVTGGALTWVAMDTGLGRIFDTTNPVYVMNFDTGAAAEATDQIIPIYPVRDMTGNTVWMGYALPVKIVTDVSYSDVTGIMSKTVYTLNKTNMKYNPSTETITTFADC